MGPNVVVKIYVISGRIAFERVSGSAQVRFFAGFAIGADDAKRRAAKHACGCELTSLMSNAR